MIVIKTGGLRPRSGRGELGRVGGGSARGPGIIDFGRNSEAIGMEAPIDTCGDEGEDGSVLEREIDRPIVLLAGDADQAVVQFAMFALLGLGPEAFGQLTATMYTTEDDRPSIRAIEDLGLACQSHSKPIAIIASAWGVLVDPGAREAIRRLLSATRDTLALRCGFSRREREREGRIGSRRASSSRSREALTEAILSPSDDAADW
jgi:hypothetical protein